MEDRGALVALPPSMHRGLAPILAGGLALSTPACTLYERAADVKVNDPALVAVEIGRERVLSPGRGAAAGQAADTSVRRRQDGAIEVNHRTIVGRDGSVSGLDSIEQAEEGETLRLPLCYRYHRGACHGVILTPATNVRELREYEEPVRVVGVMELVLAGTAIGFGTLLATRPERQHTSGAGLLITSGAVLAIIGALQTFGASRDVSPASGAGKF
jgi:hypothetical protein